MPGIFPSIAAARDCRDRRLRGSLRPLASPLSIRLVPCPNNGIVPLRSFAFIQLVQRTLLQQIEYSGCLRGRQAASLSSVSLCV